MPISPGPPTSRPSTGRRRQRQVVLGDLVALRQVRVEVVLAVPAGGGGVVPSMARPVVRTCSTARRLIVGSAPGRPRQTGHVWVFGGAPRRSVEQEQNILLAVPSWPWTSMPMTTS